MMIERIEQRVLGALRMRDRATALPLVTPVRLHGAAARVRRNRSGLYVITAAQGLEAHGARFQRPPPDPALASLEYRFVIHDPLRRYLPRRLRLRLPLDPDPARRGEPDSLFTPRDVLLYPAATARLARNWSSLRVTVVRGGAREPVAGALLRVVRRGGAQVLASGISDERGEALVIVPGVPVTRFADDGDNGGDDPVVTDRLPVRLELSHSAGAWPVDPDELERQHAARLQDSRDLQLRTGRTESVVFTLTE